MSKLKTTEIKTGIGMTKNLLPGNYKCKINSVTAEEFKFVEGAIHIVLQLESDDMGPDFVGFPIDKDKPEGAKYKGLVGAVKAGEFAFANGETKKGTPIVRDIEILKFLKNLCIAIDRVKWLDAQDNKHDTIEQLIAAFNKEKPFKNTFLNWCLCGKEYTNKGGYTSYDLFLPKFSKDGIPFEALETKPSKVLVYNPETCIKKKKSEPVKEFGEQESSEMPIPPEGEKDFEL